uniref:Immunoglobulin subtype domain-containing protein n=1 Tax=Fundulus heteroclitus TaxID=8078 RepID=A0A3Q2NW93_FUNHE
AQIVTFCSLVFALQIQGSTSVNHVFVQTGKDLILNLTEAEIAQNSKLWLWQFNGKGLVTFSAPSPPTVEEPYTGRIEVLEKKYNVKLKNLQKSDSGIYTAKTVLPTEKTLIEYNITAQDPVSSVDLTVNLTSNTSSSIFTVTCRAGNSFISSTLRCENRTCGESRGVTTSGSYLRIYQLNESITCNHSNQVSFIKATKKIEDYCPPDVAVNTATIVGMSATAAALVAVGIVFGVFRIRKRKRSPNTVYEVPQPNPQQNPYENPAEIAPAHSPTSTYALVQFPHRPEQHNDASSCLTPQPETIYAQVNRAEKTNSRPAKATR